MDPENRVLDSTISNKTMKDAKQVVNEIVMVTGALLFVGLIVGWAIDGFIGGMVGVVVTAFPAFVYGTMRKRSFLMRLENNNF